MTRGSAATTTFSVAVSDGKTAGRWWMRLMPRRARRRRAEPTDVPSVEPHRAALRPGGPADHVEQGGLAGPVRADQRVPLAVVDAQVHAVERGERAVPHADLLGVQQAGHRRSSGNGGLIMGGRRVRLVRRGARRAQPTPGPVDAGGQQVDGRHEQRAQHQRRVAGQQPEQPVPDGDDQRRAHQGAAHRGGAADDDAEQQQGGRVEAEVGGGDVLLGDDQQRAGGTGDRPGGDVRAGQVHRHPVSAGAHPRLVVAAGPQQQTRPGYAAAPAPRRSAWPRRPGRTGNGPGRWPGPGAPRTGGPRGCRPARPCRR